jgi:hypothetical protein
MAKNSKKKGNRGELELVHILEDRFGKGRFKRVPSSGAYVGGKNKFINENLTQEQKETLSSDIITPEGFKFSLEHKFYADISFWELFSDKSKWNEWIAQVNSDSEFVGKKPLLVIKYNSHKRIALIKEDDLTVGDAKVYFKWKGHKIVMLEDLLKLDDSFWFTE